MRCDETAAWTVLQDHFAAHGRGLDLREAFARDPDRFSALSVQAPGIFADLSKNLVDNATLHALVDLARDCGLEAHRDAMLRGDAINTSENRAVLHTALRAPPGAAPHSADVHTVLDAMLAFAEQVRGDDAITDIVNIGIGGSDLGPQMVVPALDAYAHHGKRLHFISNVDGHAIQKTLRGLQAEHTLFIIASKTFTTQETMANAAVARAWFLAQGRSEGDVARHFAAATTNVVAAAQFGIHRSFGFWDWVGGRYSLWSAIGLPIAIAIGSENFRALLAGAHAMDRHFADTPLAQNLPVLLGLIDVWYRNFHGFTSRSVAPYHQGLARLPAYLQQLEMESNGKRVDMAGRPLPFSTSPVVWGEPGTNGQHAYFQMLHQGTDVVPVEFIAVKTPSHPYAELHQKLLANCLAQSQALMQGRPASDDTESAAQRAFPGNRPSTTLVLEALTPHSLGALIALYEHRVFTSGALWGINSFDQWGVELGKSLCNALLPRLASSEANAGSSGLDASTAGLLERLKS